MHSRLQQGVRKSIAMASSALELKKGKEAGDLVIENDRLKTTLTVLT